jgi:hypothetical protein
MTPRIEEKAAGSAIVATPPLSVHGRGETARADGGESKQPSNPRARDARIADRSVSHCTFRGTDRSRVQLKRPSGQARMSNVDYLEQVINAECAAWLALLNAVPDYAPGRVVLDLTPLQLELVDQYLTAHAERIQALG